jgi:hypothetical protein
LRDLIVLIANVVIDTLTEFRLSVPLAAQNAARDAASASIAAASLLPPSKVLMERRRKTL